MEKTVTSINKGLNVLKQTGFVKIEGSVNELKETFVSNQLDSFKLDLSNKTATNTIATWTVARNFQDGLRVGLEKNVSSLDLDNEQDLAIIAYYKEVVRIANSNINKVLKPITNRIVEIQKGIFTDDLKAVNEHFVLLFGVKLSQENFARLKDMIMSANRKGATALSSNQFANLIHHIMISKLIKSGSYSPKAVRNTLNKAIDSVTTISSKTEKAWSEVDTLEVTTLAEKVGMKFNPTKIDYADLKAKLEKRFHKSIAVRPVFMDK